MQRPAFAIGCLLLLWPLASTADGSARSFSHTVTPTASRVEPPTGPKGYDSIRCWQAGPTPVYLGGKDVTPQNGYPICTDVPRAGMEPRAKAGAACPSDQLALRVSDLYAVISGGESGTRQSLVCIASEDD